MSTLEIKDLHVSIETDQGTKQILKGVSLTINTGEIHAIMGPNGSGKTTLAATLLGSPEYAVTAGSITLNGDDITDWPTDERAKAGLFLAFQYPQEIPGVSVIQFLRQALSARKGIDLSVLELRVAVMEWMQRLGMDSSFVDRYLNEGFSGGEKKRMEILQLAMLKPKFAILDETDSGLDSDAVRVVSEGIRKLMGPHMGVLMITHHERLLESNYFTWEVTYRCLNWQERTFATAEAAQRFLGTLPPFTDKRLMPK